MIFMMRSWILNPDSPFYWLYALSGFLILFGAIVVRGGLGPRAALRALLPAHVWFTRTARADVVMSIAQLALLRVPLDALQVAIFGFAYSTLSRKLPHIAFFRPMPPLEAGIAALVTLLAFDFATYVAHSLAHDVPFLWEFHSVHHSASQLNPFTLYREHPIDRLVRSAFRGAFTGIALAALHVFLPSKTWGAEILGVGAGFFIYSLTVHLHHSHVPIRYPRRLRLLVLSPHLHQLHHSSDDRHADRNLGVIFPYWDRLFGTYLDEEHAQGTLAFGLGDEDPYRDSVLRSYFVPFASAFQRIHRSRTLPKAAVLTTTQRTAP